MKIIFLCASLETGRDGVGDYVKRLASELTRKGHQCEAIALRDPFVSAETAITSDDDGVNLRILRIPGSWPTKQRFDAAKKCVDAFNPDLLSLQFVSFGHHPKGLPFDLHKYLRYLGGTRKWHIMFHELWVGMNADADIKMKLLGWLQKKIIVNLAVKLKPLLAHTHVNLYQFKLKQNGIEAGILPLFGNLRVKINAADVDHDKPTLRFLMFGGIHYGAPIEKFVADIVNWNKQFNYRIMFVFAGSNGPELKNWEAILQKYNIETKVLGYLSADALSSEFSIADIGITTTPEILVQKSGSVAAMKEYGLPVVCIARDWNVGGFTNQTTLITGLEDSLTFAAKKGRKNINSSSVSDIADKFLIEIKSHG
ncbi:glycosyltransferase family protein [Mucilaginibacter paludis]|uniref:Glycosyl transferase group 1 n=1 Tax=Mucilaginibacter paludis DSM 18603 TaxID=714943 RepID=H1Y0I8_9SPHI|nr:glycosyltransferase family 1 protein [Mucilaginibacter paludis]EHQ28455.1 hypothetical protein Mucpa_4365 [Mucilaginibacter paludis DSM 18603]